MYVCNFAVSAFAVRACAMSTFAVSAVMQILHQDLDGLCQGPEGHTAPAMLAPV